MEKLLSDEEKVRRAEEIYFRRNNQDLDFETKKKNISIKDRFFLHLLIMINIAIIVFCIQNKEFIFTEQFLNKLNEYNVNFSSNVTNYIKEILNENDIKEDDNAINPELNTNLDNTIINNNEIIMENNEEVNKNTNNYNNEEGTLEIKDNNEKSSVLSDDNLDIKNLKNAYSFINPINGTITSRFGIRNSENKNIDGYHTGVDIASSKGTIIKASMQGIVDEVSSVGDYGNHIKIRCNNVTTLYAHCENIFVNQGQMVAQGQTIGTVGSTGNSTGPHLHFEIRVDDRFVNPERILNI